MGDVLDMVPARLVLYMLSFTGFLVSFMMRTDINIAMVAMAKVEIPVTKNTSELYCYTPITSIPNNDSVTQSSTTNIVRRAIPLDNGRESVL